MPNQQITLSGHVLFTQSNLPIEKIRIEIWDSVGTYGMIASTYSALSGSFSFLINSPSADLISSGVIVPIYKTFRGNFLLPNVKTIQQNNVVLSIDENNYDSGIIDTDNLQNIAFVSLSGIISDIKGMPFSGVTVTAYEKGFRSETILAQTVSDITGNYSLKVNTTKIANAVVIADRTIIVKASVLSDVIATSVDMSILSDDMIVNLTATSTNHIAPSEFENIKNKISLILNGMSFEDFAQGVVFYSNPVVIDGSDPEIVHDVVKVDEPEDGNGNGELGYIARSIGSNLLAVQLIVKSYQLAQISNVEHAFMHALLPQVGLAINPILTMTETEMRNSINSGIFNNAIPAHTGQQIDAFIATAKDFQVAAAKLIPIIGETYDIGTILNKVFGGQTANADTTDFLSKYNNEYTDIDAFWSYYTGVEPIKAEKAKRGLNLASITGFQPEMIGSLMVDTATDMHLLASWSESDWVTYINDVCMQAQKLCVPVSIIGNLTDPTVIKALYAKKLRSIVQNIYPLTGVNVFLQDAQQGPTIIEDAAIRGQAVDFISDNPDFDLRINTVYDINPQNQKVNLANVTDVQGVQQALAPIQRMLRLVGGNIDAVVTLAADKIDSYSAIAALPSDDFVAAYSTVLGGPDAAYGAYSKAVALSSVSTATFTSVYQNSAQLQLNIFAWPNPNNQQDPHLDPNIKTLFGSTSYCACEQCLSVYSAAAYYTDILNFMRTGIAGSPMPNIYNELIRRRPDMEHIDMTCKNTNTLVPYIDLVIELLETLVLKRFTQPSIFLPPSFQTSGTSNELAAHPEHVYKQFSTVGGVYTWQYLDFADYVKAYNLVLNPGDPGYSALDPHSYSYHNKNLTNVVYPFNLPFSLASQETRTYLDYLGYSRADLMKRFEPYYLPTSISDFSIYSELLGITEEEGKIIANTHYLSTNTWRFYGFENPSVTNFIDPSDTSFPLISDTWDHLLTDRLDVLVQQLKMTYKQFLQFLTTDFLNKPVAGIRQITVTSKDVSRPDTCDISKLKLVFTGSASITVFLSKLHRFVRLWETNRMSVDEWDKLFTSLFITNLDATEFSLIGRILQLSDTLGMMPTELSGWWYYMDIHQYVDYGSELLTKQPSVYDLLYRNRAVINLPLPEFSDLGAFTNPATIPPSALPSHYSGFTAQIAAANNIAETDLLLILQYMTISDLTTHAVTLGELSEIYFFSTLCKRLGYSVSDLLKVLYLLKITLDGPLTAQIYVPTRLDYLDKILSAVDAINNSSLSLLEIDFLVENYSETGPASVSPLNIQFFFEKLRNELQKFPIYDGPTIPILPDDVTAYNKLKNLVFQSFSKEFNVPSEWVAICFSLLPSYFTILISSSFVSSTVPLTPDEIISISLYQIYKLAFKIALITQKFRLNTAEFEYFFLNPTVLHNEFNFIFLPVTGLAHQPLLEILFNGLLQLSRWVNVRDKLSLIDDQLVLLLKAAHNDGGDVNANMAQWQHIINRDQWGTMLAELIGNPSSVVISTPIGLLSSRFPEDFLPSNPASISKLWNVISIMASCLRTGLKPTTLRAALLQDLTMADSHQVLLAAKGKRTEDEWNAIAKPLRDTLRTKQRDALVGFAVSHPDPANAANVQKWRNENDLYAFLLIDVEMEACMKTSRIKQAICSAQLYIDRLILGLEFRNGNVYDRINLPVNMQYQWEQWRAWYRVWEANRKVFLYPENWIEPELRDDKSVFFTEMEDKLFQGDVTKERAEDALFDYLKKLQEVAKLEPMAVCDTKDPVTLKIITHVVARTYSEPYKYFYRRQVNNMWTAWERMEIEVKGNHLSMIVWRNQLYLFWLTMRERQVPGRAPVVNDVLSHDGYDKSKWFYNDIGRPNSDSSINESSPVFIKQIEITVNWSEYKDSEWTDLQIGKEKMYLDINPIINNYYAKMFPNPAIVGAPTFSPVLSDNLQKLYKMLSKDRSLNIAEIIISRINLQTFTNGVDPNVFLMIQMSNDFWSEWEYGQNIHAFTFTKDRGIQVWNSWFGGRIPAPARTATVNNKFKNWYRIEDASSGLLSEGLNTHNLEYTPVPSYCYPAEHTSTPLTVSQRTNLVPILAKSPNGTFTVFGYSEISQNRYNVLQKGFFYNDNKYGFFVRPVLTTPGLSLASAAETAAGNYYNGAHLNTVYGANIVTTSVAATAKYYFQSFFHGRVNDFLSALGSGGVDGLLKIQTQDQANTLNFSSYFPSSIVYGLRYPLDKVDFDYDGTYSGYNWELFFHMPLLVAKRLSDNQQFEEARKWYHYIFDPTSNVNATGAISNSKQRFWRFRPFYDAAGLAIASIDDLLAQINAGNAAALDQLQVWMDNPFKPHVIARMRILAYMKNVVMCYMDNLIAWADNLFRQDTIESTNQATNLYIVVSNILGDRPQEVPKRISTGPRTYSELAASGLDAFSNAMVGIENYIDPNSGPLYVAGTGTSHGEQMPLIKLFYYCLPNNPKLLAYWDTIANRLFNIRNCRNIDGQVRELPLFDPPIDPALLVRAAAAGIDAGSVLDDLATPTMPYRFTVMLQKANELCGDVKALGNALLSALEKKDSEELALLRSTQEIAVLESMKRMKQVQVDEAGANIDALSKSRDVAQVRYSYYSSRPYKSPREVEHLALMDASQHHQNTASTLSAIGSVLSILPELNIQAPFAIGPSFGGRELSAVFSALSTIQAQKAAAKAAEASKTLTEAGYERRRDDWQFQADSAQKEIIQIDKQIISAQIRKSITERDLETQELQIENAKSVDEYMHQKYTNLQLYSWMVGQISSTYFQSYQFAYDVAKRAEKCLNFEVPWISTPGTGFIRFGYWDSLKKGLMSGEKMQYDLRKMEIAYLEANTRELELTKHISIAMESPAQLLELRASGMCSIVCDRNMFDLDYPGHYQRRVKSVSISIPCVAGPYTTIAAMLTQSSAMIEDASGGEPVGTFTSPSIIALSGGQNDSGVFELNLKDERYLPFEGSGALCTWHLSLMGNESLRQFDYNTISDVIIHVKYTAAYDDSKRALRTAFLASAINGIGATVIPLYRYFSLKHEFANAWFAYANAFATDSSAQMSIELSSRMFPFLCKGKNINVTNLAMQFRMKIPNSIVYDLNLNSTDGAHTTTLYNTATMTHLASITVAVQITPTGDQTFSMKLINPLILPSGATVDMNALLDDIYLVATYHLSLP